MTLYTTFRLTLISTVFFGFFSIGCSDSNPIATQANAAAQENVTSEKHAFELVTLTTGINDPWGMTFLPDGDLLITEKDGVLYRYQIATGTKTKVNGVPATRAWGQGGLMDVLAHPEFEENRWIYLSYTHLLENRLSATRVARGQLIDDTLENIEILFTAQPAVTSKAHFGSALAFDKQGYLYITSGERHSRPMVQDLATHIGKIIRLNDDGSVPDSNPFVGVANALPEIYSYGHRNPQGIVVDDQSQQVLAVEHGPRGGDEVNVIHAGRNYGWPVITHGKEYSGRKVGEGISEKPGMEQPLHHYTPSIAPSNMIIYTGDKFPDWQGNLLIGALRQTHINRLVIDNNNVVDEERIMDDQDIRVKSIEQGPQGYIYLLDDDGRLLQLRPSS